MTRTKVGEGSLTDVTPVGSTDPDLTPPVGALSGMAPEPGQGPWRERVFTPRTVMPKEQLLEAMEASLGLILQKANHTRVAFEEVRAAWVGPLRHALEQAGGDGLDAWLSEVLMPPAPAGFDPLFPQLREAMAELRAARELASFEEKAAVVLSVVRRALTAERPRRISFRVLEGRLEGKLSVLDLLTVALSSPEELARRAENLESTLEQLKQQLTSIPGSRPEGMYANYTRLRHELAVVSGALHTTRSAG